MGNSVAYINQNSSAGNHSSGNLQDQLEPLGNINHKLYGQIQLWKQRDSISRKPTIFSKIYNTHYLESNVIQLHDQLVELYHPNLLDYYACTTHGRNILGTYEVQQQFFEYIPNTLKDYSHQRGAQLPELQIWRILEQLVSVCAYLESQHRYHGDLRLQNIFLTKKLTPKILDQQSMPGLKNAQQVNDGKVYLSPEQLNGEASLQKSDVFILGMSMIELLAQRELYFVYSNGQIDFEELKHIVMSLTTKYSQQLLVFLALMIQRNQHIRPTFDTLFDKIVHRASDPIITVKEYESRHIEPVDIQTRTIFQGQYPPKIVKEILTSLYHSPKKPVRVVVPPHKLKMNQTCSVSCIPQVYRYQSPSRENLMPQSPQLQTMRPSLKTIRPTTLQAMRPTTQLALSPSKPIQRPSVSTNGQTQNTFLVSPNSYLSYRTESTTPEISNVEAIKVGNN